MSLTRKSIQSELGYAIQRDDRYIVRLRERDGEIKIHVHQVIDGQEQFPAEYVTGNNQLVMPLA